MENEIKEPAPKYNYFTPDEYLELERTSDEKQEYYDGYIITLSGPCKEHVFIQANLYTDIGRYLKGKECRILPSTMKVSTPRRNAYIYPDATIVCGEVQMEDKKTDVLTNPTVVFEIWSPSTKKNDTGYKFMYYTKIPSVMQYIMIDPKERYVHIASKQLNGDWRFTDITDPEGTICIEPIDLTLSLNDIYFQIGL